MKFILTDCKTADKCISTNPTQYELVKKEKKTDDYNFRLRVWEKLVRGNEKHFYQGQGIGECLQRLGAHLPNEKTDLITPTSPQLPEPSPPLSNQSVLQLQLPAGGGVGGGATRLYKFTLVLQEKNLNHRTLSGTGCFKDAKIFVRKQITRQTCNLKIQKMFLKSIYH